MANPTDNAPGSMLVPPGQPQPMQPGEYVPSGAPNVVTFNSKLVTPPSPLYIQRDDIVGVEYSSLTTSETITISGRLLRASDGQIVPFNQVLKKITTTNVAQLDSVSLAEGFLLSVYAVNSNQTSRGGSFVRIFIQRGTTSLGPLTGMVQMLVADYVQTNAPIGWPGGRVLSPLEGPGVSGQTNVSNPGPGSDFAFSFGAGVRNRVKALTAKLVCSGSAGNRSVEFVFYANNIGRVGAPANVIAGSTTIFVLAPGVGNYVNAAGTVIIQIPSDLFLRATVDVIGSLTTGLLAGDQWSTIAMWSEQWEDV